MIGIFNSKSKIIKAELDPVLEKLGYPKLKRGDVDKGRIWISEKNTGGLTQKISKGQILRSTSNTAPLTCGACNTQPEGLLTMA